MPIAITSEPLARAPLETEIPPRRLRKRHVVAFAAVTIEVVAFLAWWPRRSGRAERRKR